MQVLDLNLDFWFVWFGLFGLLFLEVVGWSTAVNCDGAC